MLIRQCYNPSQITPQMTSITLLSKPKLTAVNDYKTLRSQVRAAINAGKIRAQDAVERERVRTAWEIGKLIHEHILLNQARADYGGKVIKRLSKDLEISDTELHYMVELARTYPIFRTFGKLGWSQVQALLRINDAEERDQLIIRVNKENWSVDKTRREITKLKSARKISAGNDLSIPSPLPFGKTGIYWVTEFSGKKYYDLGFSVFVEAKGKATKTNPPESELYYYNAQVLSVYDGDTFHALIDLGFGVALEQRLRLRRLNAAELPSADGEKAKRILKKILMHDGGKIQIKTSKFDDQYGRYMADVWTKGMNVDQQLLKSGTFTVRENA